MGRGSDLGNPTPIFNPMIAWSWTIIHSHRRSAWHTVRIIALISFPSMIKLTNEQWCYVPLGTMHVWSLLMNIAYVIANERATTSELVESIVHFLSHWIIFERQILISFLNFLWHHYVTCYVLLRLLITKHVANWGFPNLVDEGELDDIE